MLWIRRFIHDRRGAASIEFALTVIVFLFMVFFIAEMARMAYISSVIDLALSEGAKEAKNAPANVDGGYQARFTRRITEQGGTLWGFVTNADALVMKITYADSIADMANGKDQGATSSGKPIARYYIDYKYQPMFFPVPQSWTTSIFSREVIFVQEYERSQFMD